MKHLTATSRFAELSANIYNQDELNDWLKALKSEQTSQSVLKWIDTVLRNYMLNNYPGYVPVNKAKDDDPTWVQKAVSDGTLMAIDFSRPHMREFTQYVTKAFDYLATVPDPQRVSVTLAIDGGVDLEEKKTALENKADGKTSLLHEFANGWTWKSLLDAKSIKREGKLMQHCSGAKNQSYIANVASKKIELWSLRDESNNPHCTIEYNPKTKQVLQIKGKQNAPVTPKYQPYVRQLLQDKGFKADRSELINAGILEIGGKWYNMAELPNNMEVSGDLDLRETPDFNFPSGLHVTGDLTMEDSNITKLSSGLSVDGNLDLSSTGIEELPMDIKVGKDLILALSSISKLPQGLTVGGDLDLMDAPIEVLPTNLTVGRDLVLSGCNVTALPERLLVGKDLELEGTDVTELSKSMYIGGTLGLAGSKVTKMPDSSRIIINILNAPKHIKVPKSVKVKKRKYSSNWA